MSLIPAQNWRNPCLGLIWQSSGTCPSHLPSVRPRRPLPPPDCKQSHGCRQQSYVELGIVSQAFLTGFSCGSVSLGTMGYGLAQIRPGEWTIPGQALLLAVRIEDWCRHELSMGHYGTCWRPENRQEQAGGKTGECQRLFRHRN